MFKSLGNAESATAASNLQRRAETEVRAMPECEVPNRGPTGVELLGRPSPPGHGAPRPAAT